RAALAELLEVYGPALVEWIKAARGLDDAHARELVQGFLVRVVENTLLAKADRARGRPSTFLSTCLRNYANGMSRQAGKHVRLPDDGAWPTRANPAADQVRDRKLANGFVTRAKARVFQDCYAASP